MPSKMNQLATAELKALFEEVESGILVDFTGVGSEETYALRKALQEQSVRLRVVKTSLVQLALKELGTGFHEDQFAGPVGIAFGEDPVQVAKGLVEHRRGHRGTKLTIKGGFLERKAMTAEEVKELSDLPGRQQLLGMVAGTIAAPLTHFIGAQAAIIRKFLWAIDAVKDKREKGEAA